MDVGWDTDITIDCAIAELQQKKRCTGLVADAGQQRGIHGNRDRNLHHWVSSPFLTPAYAPENAHHGSKLCGDRIALGCVWGACLERHGATSDPVPADIRLRSRPFPRSAALLPLPFAQTRN